MPVLGPVFVLDASGQPLMPVSHAYARKLLHRATAHWIQHPTLAVLQLHHIVPQPRLQPIVAGIAVRARVTELVLLAAGTRTTHPLFYAILDLGWSYAEMDHPPVLRRHQGLGWLGQRSLLLVHTIAFLQSYLPLTHVVVYPHWHRSARAVHVRRLRQYARRAALRIIQITCTAPMQMHRYPPVIGAVQDLLDYPTPHMARVVIIDLRLMATPWRAPASFVDIPQFPRRIGTLTHPAVTGVVEPVSAQQVQVVTPRRADHTGVDWHRIVVPQQALRHTWVVSSIVVLPITALEMEP